MTSTDRTYAVAVRGGALTVGEWGPAEAPPVLAVHGITANHLSWALVAEAAPELRFVAPDLRGRGRSSDLPGPWGMAAHADDLAAVIADLHCGPVPVVGHSMGGFVAAELVRRHPELVAGLLLVDGGLPFVLPPGLEVEAVVAASLGPALQRLSMEFASPEAYRDFFRAHPALRDHWSPAVEAYVDYDLVGEAPHLRSSVSGEAVGVDSADLYADGFDDFRLDPWPDTTLLTVGRGLLDETPGLYPPETVARWLSLLPQLAHQRIEALNHYTIVLGDGAAAVAAQCSTLVARCRSRD